jgi:hypothetical protein
MKKIVVPTAEMLLQCQEAMLSSDPAAVNAAEAVMSQLTLHLRYKQALMPDELEAQINYLREVSPGCKVRNTRRKKSSAPNQSE